MPGLDATRDVATEAGVAEPTVYANYGNKAGLARALVDAVDLTAQVASDPVDIIVLLHDAGRSEPALRAAYDDGRARADHIRQGVFDTWPNEWLRPGIDAKKAADIYAATCNIGVYEILTIERSWTPENVQTGWHESLSQLLLADPTTTRSASDDS